MEYLNASELTMPMILSRKLTSKTFNLVEQQKTRKAFPHFSSALGMCALCFLFKC